MVKWDSGLVTMRGSLCGLGLVTMGFRVSYSGIQG